MVHMTARQYEELMQDDREMQPRSQPRKANLGKAFERLVQDATDTYIQRGELVGLRVPTEVVVVRGKGGKIVSAKYPKERRGKVDFLALWHGLGLAFDAKSTREKTRFPLANVEESQVWFLKHWQEQGGLSFLLIELRRFNEVWLYPLRPFLEWWDGQYTGGRKSIPVDIVRKAGIAVKSGRGVILDYLCAVKTLLERRQAKWER